MKLLILYWSFIAAGYFISFRMSKRGVVFSWVQSAMMVCIYVLCLIMGLRMGVNEQVTSNLGTIGIMSAVITVFCIGGSMGAIFVLRKIFHMDRYGNVIDRKARLVGRNETADYEASDAEDKLDLKSTFIILADVAAGMILGAKLIAGSSILTQFDSVSYYSLIVLLCILLFFVGFDLGSSKTLIPSLRNVGFRIIGFPFAAIIGTVIAGTLTCMIMGFSIKEGLAICIGFGWYSYAPVVIAGAGQQYMVASAVSFMHNVIRETTGIIFIPVLAKKIGYLEATGVPGVAAMDVCMPIIERATRPDTVLYSFATGAAMCIVTSVGVPLIMGV